MPAPRVSLLLSFFLVVASPFFAAEVLSPEEAVRQALEKQALLDKKLAAENELIQLNLSARTPAAYAAVRAKADSCLTLGPSVVVYHIRGEVDVKLGDLDGAIADFTRSIEQGAKELAEMMKANEELQGAFKESVEQSTQYQGSIHVSRADAYARKGDRARAQADLKLALQFAPGDYQATTKLAGLDKTIAEFARLARIAHPQSAADYALVGDEAYAQQKYREARVAFDQAIKLDAKNFAAYLGRGSVIQQLESPEAALPDYTRAIELSPRSEVAYTRRGYAQMARKQWTAATADLSRALELKGPDAALLNARGSARANAGEFEPALKDFDQALKLAGGDKDKGFERISAHAGRGDAYRLWLKPTEAMAAYTAAIDAGKVESFGRMFALEAFLERGKLRAAAGNKDLARADFNEVLSIDPKSEEAKAEIAKLDAPKPAAPAVLEGKTAEEWSNLGREQVKTKGYPEAIGSFSKSIELDPANAFYYSMRGYARNAHGDEAGYNADFAKAIELAPEVVLPYFLRGTIRSRAGKKAEAIADFKKVLEIDPTHAGAKQQLQNLGVK